MTRSKSRTVLAHDTDVRLRRPVAWALLCLVTGGIGGAVHHLRVTREIQGFGRARGQMPFAFTPVAPGSSTVAWLAGLLSWYVVVGSVAVYVYDLTHGWGPSPEDVTSLAAAALLLAPLWLVATHTIRRIRTVQHLAGVDGPFPSPMRGALLTAVLPPLGTWHVQRQLNRAWREYAR
jgi:hypothetical protein